MNTITENSLVWQGGKVTFHEPQPSGTRKGGGIRGKIKEMSSGSRLRLMHKTASIDWLAHWKLGHYVNFVTLTTPKEYWNRENFVGGKAIRRFEDWLLKTMGIVACIVKKEFGGKNGMYHYHLITLGDDLRGQTAQDKIQRMWTKHLEYKHGLVRTHVDTKDSNNPSVIARYLCKYVSKVGYEGKTENEVPSTESAQIDPPGSKLSASEEGESYVHSLSKAHSVEFEQSESEESEGETESAYYTGGRYWYIRGAKNICFSEEIDIDLDDPKAVRRVAIRFRRDFRKWRKAQQRKALRKKYPIGFIVHKMMGHFLKSRSYTFLKSGKGFTIMADSDTIEKLLMNALIQESCV